MRPHYLNRFFAPGSIAVIGAGVDVDSIGGMVLRNLVESGYRGELFAVNPRHGEVAGRPCLADVGALPVPVDLAIIATPPDTVAALVSACASRGITAVVVLTAAGRVPREQADAWHATLLDAARRSGIRLMGPGSMGVMRPAIGLAASFVKSGRLALVSGSSAMTQAILDWAAGNDVGFSSVMSLGRSLDVDTADVLDFLVSDVNTDSILVHIASFDRPRMLLSALRAAARVKPVILLKAGRQVGTTDGGITTDMVFDAALRRVGVVRVNSFAELFSAAKACSVRFRPSGERIAMIANGSGPGMLAADYAWSHDLPLASLTPASMDALAAAGMAQAGPANPIDLGDGAGAGQYDRALAICLADPGVDSVLVMLSPQPASQPLETTQAVIAQALATAKPVLACWMGDLQVVESRHAFSQAKVPNFRTPESAVQAFSFITAYHRSQKMLLQTPAPLGDHEAADPDGARMIIDSVLEERRSVLSDMEAKALLTAFHIPVTKAFVAHSANDAMVLAQQLGYPVALKINSPDLEHKTEMGGVRLDIGNSHDLRAAYKDLIESVRARAPTARIEGVAIEPMATLAGGREIVIGIVRDPMFGPVIHIRAGGTAGALLSRPCAALPPLNAFLAHELVTQSDAARVLQPFRGLPGADTGALERVLMRLSEMACELISLQQVEIDPLIVNEDGALAVDAHIVVAPRTGSGDPHGHMAIHPYPAHLTRTLQLPDGTDITIRPIRPEDAQREQAFVRTLSDTSRYFRFMDALHELPPSLLARFTQIDYDREMALVAVLGEGDDAEEIGVTRYVTLPDGETCEFALVVADAWHGRGIGSRLMLRLMEVARERGLSTIEGEVLSSNQGMLNLMTHLGFSIASNPQDRTVRIVTRSLRD